MWDFFRRVDLWNKGNKRVVKGFKKKTWMEEGFHNNKDVLLNNAPKFLIEEGRYAIRTRTFWAPSMKTTFLISASIIGLSRHCFMCWESLGTGSFVSSSWRYCKFLESVDWNWCLKWLTKMHSISLGFSVILPSVFLSWMMHDLALLWLTTGRKNYVFLSP